MDGKTLFYLKSNDADFGDLWKMPTGGGEESRVLRGVLHNNFDPKERGVYYATHSSSKETQFLFQDFKSGESKHLATVARYVGWGFTVSPDEQWILSTQSGGTGGSDLELVENFR